MKTSFQIRRAIALVAPMCLFVGLGTGCADAPAVAEGDPENVAQAEAALDSVPLWTSDYGYDSGWRSSRNLRTFADVNGDGRLDIVGFGDRGTFMSLSSGSSFLESSHLLDWYGYNSDAGSWRVGNHPRFMTDVDCDGRSDILGFGNEGVFLSRSLGSTFSQPTLVLQRFGYGSAAGGWRDNITPRLLGDVDGDCRPDIVGFGRTGTFVSRGTGTGFLQPTSWIDYYGADTSAGRFRTGRDVRTLADVNGDGRLDVVAFMGDGVRVSLSDGSRFLAPSRWIDAYGYGQSAGFWNDNRHVRLMRDINGDGLSDVCGFGNDGLYVSLSTGHSFASPVRMLDRFGYGYGAGSWRVGRHMRDIFDMDGDGHVDVVGFGDDGVFISRGHGSYFDQPQLRVRNFGYRSGAGSWRNNRDVRLLGDVIGAGRSSIAGFGRGGVSVLADCGL